MQGWGKYLFIALTEHRKIKCVDHIVGRLRTDQQQASIQQKAGNTGYTTCANLGLASQHNLARRVIFDDSHDISRIEAVATGQFDEYVSVTNILSTNEER